MQIISRTGTSTLERRDVNVNVSLESTVCEGHGYASHLCNGRTDWDWEYCLIVYFEPSHCNFCGNLNGTRNLANDLPNHSISYLMNLWGNLK